MNRIDAYRENGAQREEDDALALVRRLDAQFYGRGGIFLSRGNYAELRQALIDNAPKLSPWDELAKFSR